MRSLRGFSTICLLSLLSAAASAQIPDTDDSYAASSSPNNNYGTQPQLNVIGTGVNSYIRFDLTALPSGLTAANVSKATMRLNINGVTTAGTFDVYLVTSPWSESTLTYNNAPTLGAKVASGTMIVASKRYFIDVDITPAVQAWLASPNPSPNYGVALLASSGSSISVSFDSKENTSTSHDPELTVDLLSSVAVTGPLTETESNGSLTLGLMQCGNGQVLEWNGGWVCMDPLANDLVTVDAGTGLSGGGTVAPGGAVTLSCPFCVQSSTSYSDPSWITSLSGGKIVGTVPSAASAGIAVNLTGSFAGDVTGTQNATVVNALQGRPLASTIPSDGQILTYSAGSNQWQPTSPPAASAAPVMTFGGFLAGNIGQNPTTTGLFAVDKAITITHVSAAASDGGGACNNDAQATIVSFPSLGEVASTTTLYTLDLQQGILFSDSGPISVNVGAGNYIYVFGTGASGCNPVFGQSPSNVFVNVQYVMQ